MVLEEREAFSTYFYYYIRYDIMMHFRYESYMGGFLAELATRYGKYVGIIPNFYG